MRNPGRVPAQAITLLLMILCLSGCGRLIADYSLDAYKNATSLKAETSAMIDKSTEPYSKHAAEVDALNIKIDAAYEFVAGMPGNDLSAQQWAILKNPNLRSYGGFVAFWKAHGTVSKNFRDGAKKNIGEAFDQIICLEANKQALTSCSAATAAAQSDKH
jgi:hypothetical protein